MRSGVTVDDSSIGLHHAASHTQDATLAETGAHRDLSGGWYNAADYGKWTMMTAITVSYMLNLYELQQRWVPRNAKHADNRLLDEAQWGLSWILRMQDLDGGVRYKVDGATQASLSTAWGEPPERDPNLRIASPAATGSTADAAAVLYQAAQFFALTDAAQAARFRAAADRAWAWLEKHPDVRAHDLFYADHEPFGELLWARSEHAIAFRIDSAEIARDMERRPQPEVSWTDPSLLGLYRLASFRQAPPKLHAVARRVLEQQAHSLARTAAGRPFRVALAEGEYSWGSAERVLHRAALFLMADAVRPNPLLRGAALDQFAWMLGNNAVHHSFVTGFGMHPVLHPWHWTYRDYGIVVPGWAVLGPNGVSDGADPALRKLQQGEKKTGAVLRGSLYKQRLMGFQRRGDL